MLGNVFPPDHAWLARRLKEPILDPDLQIVDAHHHLWDRPGYRYLFEDYLADVSSGHRIAASVFVDASSMYRAYGEPELAPAGETEFVNGVAAMASSATYTDARIGNGIVGHADLRLGKRVAEVLEAHIAASPRRFKGIRFATGWDASESIRNSHTDPPAGLLGDADFRRGFACLESYGLSFDAWLYHPQLDEVVDLARAFPGTPIVLNHLGGPLGYGVYAGRREEVFEAWQTSMRRLAECDNVTVKIGGLAMKSAGFGFEDRPSPPTSQVLADAWRPYALACVDAFGAARCMIESNFPVDKVSAPYASVWNAYKRIFADFTAGEKAALFAGTACRVYRLDLV